jgi:threonine dehydrogenase-like Zn-dependent dehydrogenase
LSRLKRVSTFGDYASAAMRGVRNTEHGIEVLDVAEPEPPDGGTTVTVSAASICGSDLHLLAYGALPFILGHEVSGTLPDGTPVAVDPSIPCGTCDQCVAGASHLCRTGPERALGIGRHGGMADTLAVHRSQLVALPSGVPVGDACLVEPLAVAVHGLRVAGLTAGQRVAVVGGGGIGLAAVAAATATGADVDLVARHRAQHEAGERLGARLASDGEHDLVVEAAGTESALATAVDLCAPGGTVLFLSTHWTPVHIPGMPALMKELTFKWGYTYGAHPGGGRDVETAAALLGRRPEIASTLITHRFALDDAAEAFRVAADRAAGAIKVVIEP